MNGTTKTSRRIFRWAGPAVLGLLAAGLEAQMGLMTPFVDVALDRLKPGRVYEVGEAAAQPLSLVNRGQVPVTVVVEPERPAPEFLKPGYEPIPDLSWVRVEPSRLTLPPGQSARARVYLKVPRGGRWKGRHFQVSLWSHTETGTLAVGVRSRLRFSVGTPGPVVDALPAEAKPALPLAFEPESLVMEKGAALTLVNHGETPLRVRLRSVPVDGSWDRLPGYWPAPNPDFLMIKAPVVDIPAGGRRTLPLTLNVPSGPAHAGQSYVFAVKAEPASDDYSGSVLARVYAKVKELKKK